MSQRVLVTGSAGRIGRAVVAELTSRGHTVVGFDLQPTPGIPEGNSFVGSLTDADVLAKAMGYPPPGGTAGSTDLPHKGGGGGSASSPQATKRDMPTTLTSPLVGEVGEPKASRVGGAIDCLIHLAAAPDDSHFPPADTNNFESELLPSNILGGYRVMEAARRAGIRKVILASTGQVIDGHLDDRNIPVTVTASYRPRYLYACTKVFLEMLGRVYSEQHGLKVIAVRLGWCPRAGQAALIAADPEAQDVFLSPGDAGRFFAAAVEADVNKLPGWAAVYVTSKPRGPLLYDLAPTANLVGWTPTEQWPTGAEE